MLKIGITGSIGSGKSTVCKIFESLQVPVYYADDSGKFVLQNDDEARAKVIAAFGIKMYGTGNILDRAALAQIVFNDATKLAILESIVHPAVIKDFRNWFAIQKAPYIVKEAALLYEAGTYQELDKMITVSASLETRMKRVLARDKTTKEQIEARMNRQWSDEKKIEMADYIIYNDDEQMLLPQILKLHRLFGGGNYTN